MKHNQTTQYAYYALKGMWEVVALWVTCGAIFMTVYRIARALGY